MERTTLGIGDFLKSLASKPNTPDDLAAAIARVMTEKAAAESEMAVIAARRTERLIADDDAGLDADERKQEKLYRIVERCELALADLRPRLAASREAARQERWTALRARHASAMGEFIATYGRALTAYEAIVAVRGDAQNSGFTAEAAAFVPVPHILSRELLELLEAEIARQTALSQPKPAPRLVALAPKPAHIAKPKPAKPKATAPAPVPPKTEPFKPPLPDENGDVSIVVLRAGYETPGGHRPRMGETVSVPLAAGMRVVMSGAATFAEAIQ